MHLAVYVGDLLNMRSIRNAIRKPRILRLKLTVISYAMGFDDVALADHLTIHYTSMVSQSMHEISACKPRTVQPFLVAVLTFAVLACRRFDQAPADHVKSLGVTLQQDLSFDLHVIQFLKQCS